MGQRKTQDPEESQLIPMKQQWMQAAHGFTSTNQKKTIAPNSHNRKHTSHPGFLPSMFDYTTGGRCCIWIREPWQNTLDISQLPPKHWNRTGIAPGAPAGSTYRREGTNTRYVFCDAATLIEKHAILSRTVNEKAQSLLIEPCAQHAKAVALD